MTIILNPALSIEALDFSNLFSKDFFDILRIYSTFLTANDERIGEMENIMEEVTVKKMKCKKLSSRDELELLEKEILIDKILQLEAHTLQLKNVIKKQNFRSSTSLKSGRPFDFSQSQKRHILLKFYYLGWEYNGFVEQEDTIATIEHHIFEALRKSCLIESRDSSNYHRCGRTDKGVSAFSQVISLDIRSRLEPESQWELHNELPYCKMLNRILPRDIKCIAWAAVKLDISARFDCKRRTYKYFFPRGNLNIEAMSEASRFLIGHHDFRNFCKMDVSNGVVAFERTITDAKIVCNDDEKRKDLGYSMCQLVIESRAFLWHQIRCIMGVLLLVGQGNEKPNIILELFDIGKNPCKPQYSLAHELPLNLFHCEYDDADWFYEESELSLVIKTLQEDWTMNSVKSAMIKDMVDDLKHRTKSEKNFNHQADCLITGVRSKIYQPLMKRVTSESLENRINHFKKKRKIDVQTAPECSP